MADKQEWGIAADIRKILSDDNGNLSSKRVLAVLWGVGVFFVWAFVSVRKGEMAPLAWEHVGIVLSLAGVVAAGKWGEKPGGTP
jgi:hypothetical protein